MDKQPTYNEYWQAQNVPQHLSRVGNIPVMIVGGWWDAEDLYGPLAIFKAIQEKNSNNNTVLVMGPWYHGSWNSGPGTSLHDITWTTRTGEDYRNNMQRPFFRHYLWGDGPGPDLPKAMMFDTGADTWRSFSQWPPETTTWQFGFYENRLTTPLDRPRGARGPYNQFSEFVSDPNRPVPASATMSTGMPRSYLIEDQRFVWTRSDVLSFETAPLEEDVTLAGPITVSLHVATTGTDADFIVKLIDVFSNDRPNNSPRGSNVAMGGYQMLIRGEPMRARYRNSWTEPEPVPASLFDANIFADNPKIVKIEFVMPDVLHTFKTGHKIMVQVQSSWFPVVDRNPQTFVPNIFFAEEADFRKATHRIYTGEDYASSITVGRLR